MSAVSAGITHNNVETQLVEAAGVQFAYRPFGRPAELQWTMEPPSSWTRASAEAMSSTVK
jgi:hypothetical protein